MMQNFIFKTAFFPVCKFCYLPETFVQIVSIFKQLLESLDYDMYLSAYQSVICQKQRTGFCFPMEKPTEVVRCRQELYKLKFADKTAKHQPKKRSEKMQSEVWRSSVKLQNWMIIFKSWFFKTTVFLKHNFFKSHTAPTTLLFP